MNRILTPVIMLLLLAAMPAAASAQKAKDKLVGTWVAKLEIDEAKAKEFLKKQGVPDEFMPMVLIQMKAQLTKMSFEATFRADGTCTVATEGLPVAQKQDLKWEVVSEAGKTAEIKTTNEKDKEEETVTITFLSDDKCTFDLKSMKEAPVKPLVFTRKKKATPKKS